MASTYTDLGLELMATGENAGTWGTKTNANLNLVEQISGGYATQALTSGGTVTLVKSDGSTGAVMATRVWKLTGALSDNAIVTVPDSIENWWIINNASTNAYTVQVKTVSGTGITWATTDKGTKILYTDGTNVIDATSGFGDVTLTGTQTLTNKTLTSPKINEDVAVTSTATELNYNDLTTLGTSAASKIFTADANNLTKVSGAVLNTEDILTDEATVTWNVINSPVAKLTLGGNRILSAPSGTTPAAGQFISLLAIQDGTGSRTITWNAVYEFPSDTAPTLTTTASLGDIFSFRYNGSKWLLIGQTLALTLS
jgi:hypothetical protein